MFAILVSFLVLASAYTAETECRAFPVDYDVSECDGLDEHMATFGTYDNAMAIAHTCETPTSWAEQDPHGHWFAVCGTADGRVCGRDVPWTDYDCQESQHHNPVNPAWRNVDSLPTSEECNQY